MENTEKIIWKDIIGYEGSYKISNLGEVISLVTRKDKSIMTPFLTPKGYLQLKLYKNGKKKGMSMHRLMAIHFIPNPENKLTVNHINGIKTDYRLENLEWATYSENNKHAFDTGLNKNSDLQKKVTALNNKKRCSKPILNKSNGDTYLSIADAAVKLKMSGGHICNMINGKQTNKFNLIYI
jgi:hypothetical protein